MPEPPEGKDDMIKQKEKIKTMGFGFVPQDSTQHFVLKILDDEVMLYHNFLYKENINTADYESKACISIQKWNLIKDMLQDEFNARMIKSGYKKAKWQDETIIESLFGKELVLLVWAIESNSVDDNLVEKAIINWKGLSPEERWYLFTMTNANCGKSYDLHRGWRKALKYIFTEN